MITDLRALDRLAARAAIAILDGQEELLETGYREVAKQSVQQELLPIAPKLAAHVAHFTLIRIASPMFRELRAAYAEPREPVRDLPRTRTSAPSVSVDDAVLEAISARSLDAAREWLSIADRNATRILDAERHHREIAIEISGRLGIADDDLREPAEIFLARTSDLARSIADEPAALLLAATARNAGDGWPRRPSLRFALEAFGTDAKARRTIERFSARRTFGEPIGAASHLRAMRAIAFDWHARSAGDAQFAERHEPEWSEAHASSLLVAAALASPVFQKRALGLVERTARAQARALAVTALVAARTDAARVLAPSTERSEKLFFQGLAPIVPRPMRDARGRFRGWLALPGLLDRAVALHDDDWFRNPRFWEEMAIRFASPPEPIPERDLAKMFEEKLA